MAAIAAAYYDHVLALDVALGGYGLIAERKGESSLHELQARSGWRARREPSLALPLNAGASVAVLVRG